MEFLAAIAVAVATTWGLLVYRQLSLVQTSWLMLIAGICVGYDFFHRSLGPLPVTLDRLIWAGMLAHFAVAWLGGETNHRRLGRVDFLLLAFAAAIALNLAITDAGYQQNQPVATFLFFVALPVGSYLMVRCVRLRPADDRRLFWGAMGLGLYLALTAIAETRGWHGLVFPKYILDPERIEFLGRGRGPLLNPVANGLVMTTCLIIGLNQWGSVGWPGRLGLALFAVVMLAGCYSTLTRTVWLATAFACGNWLFWHLPFERRIALLAGACLMVGLLLGGAKEHLTSFKRDKHVTVEQMEESARLRPLLASVAWRMFCDQPVRGHGFGQYLQHHEPYHSNGEKAFWEDGTEPWQLVQPYVQHNLWLSLLVDLGLIGAVLFAAVLCGWFWQAIMLWRHEGAALWQRRYGLVTMTVLSSYLINGLFHDVFIVPMANCFLFTLVGLSVNAWASVTAAPATQSAPRAAERPSWGRLFPAWLGTRCETVPLGEAR